MVLFTRIIMVLVFSLLPQYLLAQVAATDDPDAPIVVQDPVPPILIDGYSGGHEDATASLNGVRTAVGQVFVPASSAYLRFCQFVVSKEGAPTGTMVAKLYAVSGTPGLNALPSGPPLLTSAPINVASFSSWPTLTPMSFEFPPAAYLIRAGVPHAVVVEYLNGTASNTVPIPKDNAGTHAGNKVEFSSGAWVADAPLDMVFYVYGDSPGAIQFSSPTYVANENSGTATVRVARSGGSAGAVFATFSTKDGTATAGNDYMGVNQIVSFGNGDNTDKTVTIAILDDALLEHSETLAMTLTNPNGGAVLGPVSSAEMMIIDNEEPPAVLIESYSEANQDATASLNGVRTAVGQVFVPSLSAYLRSSKFYLSKEGNPVGPIVAKLYAVSGTPGSTAVATGPPLAVSSALAVSDLSPWPVLSLVTFHFPGTPFAMLAGVPYAIVVEYSGGNATNLVPVGKDNSGSHPGNKTERDGDLWVADAPLDTIFYVYGDPIVRKRHGQMTSQ